MPLLPLEFYLQKDAVALSEQLLGKVLCTKINGTLTSGIICETEAYAGIEDKASHAYGDRRTARTETMYQEGGISYVYLCYGIHHLFNVVCNLKDIPHAVLIRGILPLQGVRTILERRGKRILNTQSCIGPGKMSQALGISIELNGVSLTGNKVWIEDLGLTPEPEQIIVSKRIGIDYAEEDANLPYRFEAFNFSS